MNDRTFFILVDREAVPADLETWAAWAERADRHVALTEVAPGVAVSTVFLGIDMNWRDTGPPILFETMTFCDYGEGVDGFDRYSTWSQAEAGHAAICARLTLALDEDPDWRPKAPQGRS